MSSKNNNNVAFCLSDNKNNIFNKEVSQIINFNKSTSVCHFLNTTDNFSKPSFKSKNNLIKICFKFYCCCCCKKDKNILKIENSINYFEQLFTVEQLIMAKENLSLLLYGLVNNNNCAQFSDLRNYNLIYQLNNKKQFPLIQNLILKVLKETS